MSPYEYLLALVSILIGLAIADLALSLHRLLRARVQVRWDWLPLAASLLVAFHILTFWWALFGILRLEVWLAPAAFLVLAAFLVCLFLLAAAALPDAVPDVGLDLRDYYEANLRYFWTLFAVFLLLATGVMATYTQDPGTIATNAIENVVVIAISFSLAAFRSRRFHAVAVPVLIIHQLAWFLQLRLM